MHPQLEVVGEIVRKGSGGEDGYSGFTVRDPVSGEEEETKLEDVLRNRDIKRVVVVGLATDYCVKETALDALERDFVTEVLADAVRAVDLEAGDGDRGLEAVRSAGGRIVANDQ